jgi:hypothetical protein
VGKSEEESKSVVESKIFKGGVIMIKVEAVVKRSLSAAKEASLKIAGGTIFSPVAWSFAGLVYLAQTGCNYRKMKAGTMTKEEFK